MRKINFLFAFLLSVMGVTQAWADYEQSFVFSGLSYPDDCTEAITNAGWECQANRWTFYNGCYDYKGGNYLSDTELVSPLMTKTKNGQLVTFSGWNNAGSSSVLKILISYDKTNWTLVADLKPNINQTTNGTASDISAWFVAEADYYVKLICNKVCITNFKVEESEAQFIYLKPNSDWSSSSARFAVYMWGNGDKWANFFPVENEDGVFVAPVFNGSTGIKICRMDGSKTYNLFDDDSDNLIYKSIWNTTGDITGENLFGDALYSITGWDNSYTVSTFTPTVLNTYTATMSFTNYSWDKVYAYTWTGEGSSKVEHLGEWPGTELTAVNGVYTVTLEATEAPAYIIFNDDNGHQTEDLVFVDGKAYTVDYTAPVVEEAGIDVSFGSFALPAGWIQTDNGWTVFGFEGTKSGNMAYDPNFWGYEKEETTSWITAPVRVAGTDDVLTISAYKWAPNSSWSYNTAKHVTLKVWYSTDKENWTEALSLTGSDFATAYVLETKTVSGIEAGTYFFKIESNNIAFDYLYGFSKAENSEFTVSVENVAAWNTISAYAWSGEEGQETKFLGDWPGTTMTQNEGTNVWTLTFSAPLAPAHIIFNNGLESGAYQTRTLDFENNKQYVNYFKLALDEAATENQVVADTYDEVTVAFKMEAGKFAAFCLPFATTTTALGEGVKAWAFTGYDGNINLETTTELAAATPYIIYAANGINGLTFQNVTIESNKAGKVEQGAATFQGSYVKMAVGTMTGKYGVTPAGKIQKAGSGASMKAFRAYFDGITQGAKLVFDGEIIGEATGIDTIENAAQAGELYDLQGRRVLNAQKGLYIQNGKKFVVK